MKSRSTDLVKSSAFSELGFHSNDVCFMVSVDERLSTVELNCHGSTRDSNSLFTILTTETSSDSADMETWISHLVTKTMRNCVPNVVVSNASLMRL